jgi:hypothetical protein
MMEGSFLREPLYLRIAQSFSGYRSDSVRNKVFETFRCLNRSTGKAPTVVVPSCSEVRESSSFSEQTCLDKRISVASSPRSSLPPSITTLWEIMHGQFLAQRLKCPLLIEALLVRFLFQSIQHPYANVVGLRLRKFANTD